MSEGDRLVGLSVELTGSLGKSPAICLGLENLHATLSTLGMGIVSDGKQSGPRLVVKEGQVETSSLEGFRISKTGQRTWQLVGASESGVSRALTYLADRAAIEARLPDKDVVVDPAFPLRFILVGAGSLDTAEKPFVDPSKRDSAVQKATDDLKSAHLAGANHIIFHSTYRVARWGRPPQSERTDAYRDLYSELCKVCHRYGMKALIIGDEFLYEDEALRKAGARLSPEDDRFWNLLQDRYRDVLEGVPELDGVGVRIGEMLPIGSIKSFDVIHNGSKLSLEEKYRRFVRAMYQVVVEEYDKLYYHRTWVVNDWEQHSVPAIYKSIFEDMPTRNLIISVKLTKCDQWWYQAFNPNFGLTPHTTSVELETHHGPHGSMRFPDYMGEWFQAGLKYALGRDAKGVFTGLPTNLWMSAHHYAATRLAWEPGLSASRLAEDWASRVFGRAARKHIARMLLLSDDAMRKALYIKPYAATHAWNPLSHILTGMFVVEGQPLLDGGAGHAKFLRELYLLAKPEFEEMLREMQEGLAIWDEMLSLYGKAAPSIRDRELLEGAKKSLADGRSFLALNVAYVAAFMEFFRFEEEASERYRRKAARSLGQLRKAMRGYLKVPGHFDLIGIRTFIDLADIGMRDLAAYRSKLEAAPGDFEKEEILRRARAADAKLVESDRARRLLYFEADVDGSELIIVKGGELKTQHLADEQTTGIRYEFYGPIPKGGRLAIKPIDVRGWAYVAEQPSKDNSHTAKIVVEDPQDGRSVYRFEVYWVPEEAQQTGA